jgi:hypothetical protein
MRQLGLYAAGVGFFGLSMAITRRSIVRRYKATVPKFYYANSRPAPVGNGAMEAFEALNIATINVFSVGMMLAGGTLWAFDISSIDDMRQRVRTNMGLDEIPKDQDAEEEIEEWIAQILSRKEFKALRGKEGITDEQLEAKIKRAKERLEEQEKKGNP